jgi:hypothetical protein
MSLEQHPALTAERIALREKLGLRSVRDEEEGRNIEMQATGIYGYTGAPATEELPLFIKPVYRCTEVHKLASGEVCLLGYVTPKEAQAFEAGTEPIIVQLYPDPVGESNSLISVPVGRIDRRRPPSRDDGNSMMVEIAPAM